MVKSKINKKIITDYLKSKIQSLQAVIIFGSFAHNLENRYSDIDIAFLSSKKVSKYRFYKPLRVSSDLPLRNRDKLGIINE